MAQGYADSAQRFPERFRTVVTSRKKSDTARAVFAQIIDLFPTFDLSLVPFDSLDGKGGDA